MINRGQILNFKPHKGLISLTYKELLQNNEEKVNKQYINAPRNENSNSSETCEKILKITQNE